MIQSDDSFGSYKIVRQLGKGGMGEVWLARHEVLDSFFAIKIIPSETFTEDPESEARFYREAKVAAKICHPALVRVYDAGRDEKTGCFYLVMDYMPGGTVAEKLQKVGRFSVPEAAKIVHRVAEGLEVLNQAGVVHRDVKPSNLLIDARGDVRLSDPGIARVPSTSRSRLTQAGFALGTPLYMPFEQVVDSHCVDGRADIHALGITLFELLTGACPFSELNSVQLLKLRADGARIPDIRTFNREVPEELARFVAKMTEPDVNDRVASAAEVVATMEKYAYVEKRAEAKVQTERSPTSEMPWLALSMIGLSLVLAIAAIAVWWCEARIRERSVQIEALPEPEIRTIDAGRDVAPILRTKVEKITVSVTNTVVVTNFVTEVSPIRVRENLAKLAVHGEAIAPKEPRLLDIEVGVCGIAVKSPAVWRMEIDWLTGFISEVDVAVRALRGFDKRQRVQDAVNTIVVVDVAGDKGYQYDKREKRLEISKAFIANHVKATELVLDFMLSRRDSIAEPGITNEIMAYVRCRVQEKVLPSADMKMFYDPIRMAESIEDKEGRLDFHGRRWIGGSYRQIVGAGQMSAFRLGKVFKFFRTLEVSNPRLLGAYFHAKREAADHRKISGRMTLNDFVALLSVGCGENLFPDAKRFGLHVDPQYAKIRVKGLWTSDTSRF